MCFVPPYMLHQACHKVFVCVCVFVCVSVCGGGVLCASFCSVYVSLCSTHTRTPPPTYTYPYTPPPHYTGVRQSVHYLQSLVAQAAVDAPERVSSSAASATGRSSSATSMEFRYVFVDLFVCV